MVLIAVDSLNSLLECPEICLIMIITIMMLLVGGIAEPVVEGPGEGVGGP